MTSTHSKMFDNNVTIMKYLSTDGEYKFKVLDKFNEQDEVSSLLKMINISKFMLWSAIMRGLYNLSMSASL